MKRSWISFSLLALMLVIDIVFIGAYIALVTVSSLRARSGNPDYYIYMLANTLLTFVIAFVLTITGIVFVIHERLILTAKKESVEREDELKDLDSHQYLSIDFSPEKKASVDGASPTALHPNQTEANFILHDQPIPDAQAESDLTFRLKGQGSSELKASRVTLKNISDVDISYVPFKFHKFVPLTILSCIGMYVFFILFIWGFTLFAWAIILSQYYGSLAYKIGWTFAVVDFTSGFLAPILLLSSLTIAALLLSYFTRQEISLRSAVTPLLGSVRLFRHQDGKEYWLVGRRFRYDLSDRHTKSTWFTRHSWIEGHYSTWAFWIVICLSILFSFAQFINLTVISEQTSSSCVTDFDCFLAVRPFSFEHIICPDGANSSRDVTFMRNNSVAQVPNNTVFYCFKYLDFGFDNSLFLALGSTYALYLFSIAVFNRIFNAFAVFIQLKQTRLWGVLLILLGLAGFIIILIIYFLNGYHTFLFDILRLFEVFIFSMYMIVVGVLVLVYFHQKDWHEILAKRKHE